VKKRTPNAERLLQARKIAAKELRLPVTDWRVRRYALLVVMHDNATARLASGGDFNLDNLLKIETALQEIRATVPVEPIEVKLTVVKSVDSAPPRHASIGGLKACRRCGWQPPNKDRIHACYRCGWKRGGDTAAPWQPIDIAGVPSAPEQANVVTPDVRAPVEPVANVVQLQQPRRNPGSIHDAPGARMARTDYSAVSPVDGYDPVQRAPDWSAHHQWPEIT
jgi:hypothetical protein